MVNVPVPNWNPSAFGSPSVPLYVADKVSPFTAVSVTHPCIGPVASKDFWSVIDIKPSVEAPTPWASATNAYAEGPAGPPQKPTLPVLGAAANATVMDAWNGYSWARTEVGVRATDIAAI